MNADKTVFKNVSDKLSQVSQNIIIYECPMIACPPHDHDFLELAYVLEGEAEHICDDTTTKITAGNLFIIDYGSVHSYKAITPTFVLLNCLFKPKFIDNSLSNSASFMSIMEKFQLHISADISKSISCSQTFFDKDGEIKNILLKMLKEFDSKAPGYLHILRSKLTEALILSIREVYMEQSDFSLHNGDLSYVHDYIHKNYMNDILFKDICSHLNYSEPHLSMKFKRHFGLSYTEYLQKFRVERSMHLLLSTNLSVAEVAQQVGYNDIKSFYSAFKKYIDTTPAKFRKNSLKK